MIAKTREQKTYMLCDDCGYAYPEGKMFKKWYKRTAICLCRKCSLKLAEEIAETCGGKMLIKKEEVRKPEEGLDGQLKIGTTVYEVGEGGRIYSHEVRRIIYDTKGVAFDDGAIGKSVFLDLGQAKRILEEKGGRGNVTEIH